MHLKKITVITLSMLMLSAYPIQAATNDNVSKNEDRTRMVTYSTSAVKYELIELNKEYTHELRYEPYDKSYDGNLYVEINLPQDGYITFNRGDFESEKEKISDNWLELTLMDKNLNEIRKINFYHNLADKYNYKIGLKKGNYKIKLNTDKIHLNSDATIKYRVNFTPANIIDIEPDAKVTPLVDTNKEYEGNFDSSVDHDYYKFINKCKSDVKFKFKAKGIEDVNDFNKVEYVKFYKVSKDDRYLVTEVKFNELKMNEDGYFEHTLTRLPKGEYEIELFTGYSNYKPTVQDYKFQIEIVDWKEHWAKNQIKLAMDKGWVNKANEFRPDDPITRAEFVKIFNRAFGLTSTSGKVFEDTANHWSKNEIDIAVTNGVTNGVSANKFDPDASITREQVAKMISNYKKLVDTNYDKLNGYNDGNNVSDWAKSSVEAILEAGYMKGYDEDNTFRPKNNITRAEALVTLGRI